MEPPVGICTCPSWLAMNGPEDQCDYCQAMMHWAHYELYPDDRETPLDYEHVEWDPEEDEDREHGAVCF